MNSKRFFLTAATALSLFASVSTPLFAQAQGKEKGADAVRQSRVLLVPQDYKLIQAALDSSEAGDTVFVSDGVYKENIVLRDSIALIGISSERVVIVGDRKKPAVRGAQGAALRHVTVTGGHTGVLCANVFMTIEGCVIRGNRVSGIHCIITVPVIRNNIIFRNGGSGVFCETTRSHRGAIVHNLIAENTYSGVHLAGQSEVLVENNTLYFNKQYGVFAAEGARRSRLSHNAFYGNRHAANIVAMVDRTNVHFDPGYNVFAATGYAFWEVRPEAYRGRGRENRDIGLERRSYYVPLALRPGAGEAKAKPKQKAVVVDTVKVVGVDTVKADVKVDVKVDVVDTAKVETKAAVVDTAKVAPAVLDVEDKP